MPLHDVLVNDPVVRQHLSVDQLAAALDPAAHIGSAGALVDRALEAHRAGELGAIAREALGDGG